MRSPLVLALDFGGVLTMRMDLNDPASKQYVAGAIEGTRELVELYGSSNAFVVSRVDAAEEARTRAWHDQQCLFERTGLDPAHIIFCREKSDKAPIYRRIRATHVVDNRLEVFLAAHAEGVELRRRYLLQCELEQVSAAPPIGEIKMPLNWPHLVNEVRRDFRRDQLR